LRELAAIAGESNVRYNQELSRIIRAELLVLNDPFKVKLTDKVEEALWEIVDERYEEERPIITTMNGVAKNIEPLLSPDRGKALFRRLREENHAIHFPNPETKR
jgi:DNA replication protein DnaC